MAAFGDAEQAVAVAVVEGAAERRLAGGGAEQQGFGCGAMAFQVDQGGADDMLAQIAGGYTHDGLVLL
ncbi:hypothetical protein D9M72_654230 [compost metagenome]